MMSARLVAQRGKVVAYLPGLRSLCKHFRAFSAYSGENLVSDHVYHTSEGGMVPYGGDSRWPDLQLGPLAPRDKRFPLPGMSGPIPGPPKPKSPLDQPLSDVLTGMTASERQAATLEEFMEGNEKMNEHDGVDPGENPPSPMDVLECVAQECPELLRKDFQTLFPDQPLSTGTLTVLTLSQRTENDMSGWSPDVDEEREVLLEHFVAGSQDICNALQQCGFWADFIDPSSGRPYLGAYTNTTLFETDERYRHFGFEIDDLGCCKVIRHHLWGSHAYVGCLFTNAPLSHPVIQQMTKKTE